MSILLQSRKWSVKPPLGSLAIDWSKQITSGLQVAIFPSNSLADRELVRGNAGTIQGTVPTLVAFGNGAAISLTAVNQGINYSTPTVPDSFPLTVACYCQNKGSGGGDGLGKCNSNSFSPGDYAVGGARFDGSQTSIFGVVDANGTASYVYFGAQATLQGKLSHLVMTYDGANVLGYLNGVLVATTVKTAAIAGTTKQVSIGGTTNTSSANANVGYGMIWNRALSPVEIQQLYIDPYGVFRSPSFKRMYISADAVVAAGQASNLMLMGCGF